MFRFITIVWMSCISILYGNTVLPVNSLPKYLDCSSHIEIFFDKEKKYSMKKIPPASLFQPLKKTSLGYQFDPIWTKLSLKNNSETLHRFFLVNPRTGMDKIDVFILRNTAVSHYAIGDTVPLHSKIFPHRYPVVILTLAPHEQITVISKVYNNVIVETSWILSSPEFFWHLSELDMIIWGLFYGLVLAIILYALNSYVILKNKVFLLYVMIAVSSALHISSFNGIAYAFSPFLTLNNVLFWIFMPVLLIFIFIFSKYFFNTAETMPKINQLINVISITLIVFGSVLSVNYLFFESSSIAFNIKKGLIPIVMVYLLPVIIGINAIRVKLKGSLYYTIGQGFFALTIGYQVLFNSSSTSFSFTTLYAPIFGLIVDLIFLSFALGQYFRYIKEKKEQHEKVLIAQSSFTNIGKTIGHITHQWKMPITQIGTSLTLLETTLHHRPDLLKETFEMQLPKIHRYFTLLKETTDDLISLYQSDSKRIWYSPKQSIHKVLDLLHSKITLKKSNVILAIPDEFQLYGQPSILSNILLVLIDNTLDACDGNVNEIVISISDMNDIVHIIYVDNAGGIHIEPIENVFNYFLSSKESGQGIGLSIVKVLVEQELKGEIFVENTTNGVRFEIVIPKLKEKNLK